MTFPKETYDMMRAQLMKVVPFATHIGIDLVEMGDGTCTAKLALAPEKMNHIQTMHAGAVYTLGEAASGGAATGALVDRIMNVKPLAAEGQIKYLKVSKGDLTAKATTSESGEVIRSLLDSEGKAKFDVDISFTDETGATTAEMKVKWAVKA